MLIYSTAVKDAAKDIADEIAKEFDYALRSDETTPKGCAGVKIVKSLYVLKHTKAKAVLIEPCFVDDKDDAKVWNADRCAKAIVRAITGKAVSSGSSTSGSSGSSSGSTASGSTSASKATVTVDGYWGPNTTKALQKIFGTTVDGKVSNQYECYKDQNPGLEDGWEWEDNPSGYSPLIKAIQKMVGATQDGHIGPKTIKANILAARRTEYSVRNLLVSKSCSSGSINSRIGRGVISGFSFFVYRWYNVII